MRDRFHVGQRVLWKTQGSEYTATIISQRQRRRFMATRKCAYVYGLDVDGYGVRGDHGYEFAAEQRELWPLDDRDTPVSWTEFERVCGWTPKVHASGGLK